MKKLIIFLLIVENLVSAGVSAGTEIKNVAYLHYKVGAFDFNTTSNLLVDIVDQKLDMQMSCQESDVVMVGVGEKKRALSFSLSNTGNGIDTYEFTPIEADSRDFTVENAAVYIDNGDGVFSESEDSLATEIKVVADGNISLFLVSDIPNNAVNQSANGIKALSSMQGSLSYGESKKLNDFYAVVAMKEEAKSDFCTYGVSPLALELEKSATLSSDKLYKGTTIEYKIDVKVVGVGTIENVLVKDNVPTGTVYIDESLKLDGVLAGDFNGSAILVAFNSIVQENESSEPLHTITFEVKVQ
ncbi:MAG: Similarity [uncultured Sulfurovum sp.]|uniref:Similarity n=1 Tax=uncultured Sulfurovum sp. TaxID=269237 RepID=A0A6S6TK80_9BACT|nr:MAG: Similarity [uncultured Sulfurovum sp.]